MVTMHAYCGMAIPLAEGDLAECREVVKRKIKRHTARGGTCTVLEKGRRYELQTPDDAFMIRDDEGILTLSKAN